MVVVEHQASAVLIVIVESERAIPRIICSGRGRWIGLTDGIRNHIAIFKPHIRNIFDTYTFRVKRVLTSRCCPLVRSAIADPGHKATMKMHSGSVYTVILALFAGHWIDHHRVTVKTISFQWSLACAHQGRIHWQEKITISGKTISKFDSNGNVLFCNDHGSQMLELIYSGIWGIGLPIAVKSGRGKIGMQLFFIFAQFNLIVVITRIGRGVGDRYWQVLTKVVGSGSIQTG